MSISEHGSHVPGPGKKLRNFVMPRLHIIGMILLLLGLYVGGVVQSIDRGLIDLRFLFFPRDASGNIVIVQIDSKSLQALGEWPWSRSLHAKAVNKLSSAGVSRIGIDIDFSSPSPGEADEALIQSLAESKARIVLPVFKQWSSTRGGEVTTTAPMQDLAKHVLLGSVNVRAAPDGLIREYDRLQKWEESFVPSFATELTGRTTDGTSSFLLDYSIRPETIPRISFVDVLNGQFDTDLIKGKSVIIGATALELGDELAVPIYGALSGPELQAMAGETILLGRAIMQPDDMMMLGAALLVGILLGGMFVRLPHVRGIVVFILAETMIVLLSMIFQTYFPVNIPVGATLVILAYCFVHGLTKQLDMQALIVFKRSAEIRERRALNQAIADNSFTGIIVADHAGKIRFANKAASAMLMVPQSALIDRDAAKVILPEDNEVSLSEPTSAQSKIYTSLKIAGNNSLPVEITVSNVSISPQKGPFERRTADRNFTIYAISDISVFKQSEEVLSRAAEQANEANRTKTEFVANMSHELRTPLNAILGFSETIKSELYGPVGSEKYKAYAEDIYNSGAHLLAIINDLLEVSQFSSGNAEAHTAPVEINKILQECMHIASGYPGANRLNILTDVDDQIETIWTDERIIKQIILNILSNAIKFTPANGKIWVGVKLTHNGGMDFIVEDTGIGIPVDQLDRVFEPFHQVENAMQRKYHGSGLGLHLVKSQVELLGGTLQIESKVRVGTRIKITFPPEITVTVGKIVKIDRK